MTFTILYALSLVMATRVDYLTKRSIIVHDMMRNMRGWSATDSFQRSGSDLRHIRGLKSFSFKSESSLDRHENNCLRHVAEVENTIRQTVTGGKKQGLGKD